MGWKERGRYLGPYKADHGRLWAGRGGNGWVPATGKLPATVARTNNQPIRCAGSL